MAETEHITVAEVSEGTGGRGDPGTPVSLPVVELLTGRGFVTGKSGSGKSNSASVIAEKLLDNGFGLLIVDIDGEYYGLKEEYEILHAGADEECDIQITEDHAEKMASLALEQNVPIILDISSFLDEDEAESVLTAVSRHLFAKAKKQKQPFLMLVEEVHEYIPEGGSVGECGKMLIKIGKRGRKHGLGIVGISQRPADVKKDFITQCDWLVWHRLTWNNDTKVVSRILDSEYAAAVEDLDDGEGFLMTDWAETVQRVQFHRKQTFDAGATPGLDDFERPELKSVSDNLVSELESISEEQQAREDRIAELRTELDEKNSRIAELERELQDARDLSRMADQFVDSLVQHVDGANPGKTEQERLRERRQRTDGNADGNTATADSSGDDEQTDSSTESDESTGMEQFVDDEEAAEAFAAAVQAANDDENADEDSDDTKIDDTAEPDGTDSDETSDDDFSASDVLDRLNAVAETPVENPPTTDGGSTTSVSGEPQPSEPDIIDTTASTDETIGEEDEDGIIDGDTTAPPEFLNGIQGGGASEYDIIDGEDENPQTSEGETEPIGDEEPLVVRELKADIAGLPTKTRKMLAYYREFGPGTPLNAHFSAGGNGDRTEAYAHNRTLRTHGLVEHVGRGRYEYRLRDYLREEFDGHVDPDTIDEFATNVEQTALDGDQLDDDSS